MNNAFTYLKFRKIIRSCCSLPQRWLLVVTVCLISQHGSGQILAWDFNGNDGTQTTVVSTTTNANLNTSTVLKGAGLNNPAGGNAFSGSFGAVGYATGTTSLATAITAQEYLSFTVSAKAHFKVSLSTLNVNFLRSTGNAPTSFQWQYSLDGFATSNNIGTTITYLGSTTGSGTGGFVAANGTAQTQINLSTVPGLQNVYAGTTITFRLYGWGAGNTGSTFALGSLAGNDLAIGGSLVPLSAPTVTTQPSGASFCQGPGSFSLTAAATGDPLPTVQWQKNGQNIAGATSATLTINSPTGANDGSYTAVFTNSEGSTLSNAAVLNVNPVPLSQVTATTNITCNGANNGTVTVSASGGTSPYQFSLDNGGSYQAETAPDQSEFLGLAPNVPYRVKVKDNNGCISK